VQNSRSNLNSPEVVETLTFLKELHDSGVCAPGTLSKTDPMKLEEFAANRVGLMITTMPQIAALRQRNAELNFSVAPVPKKKVWAYRVHGWELGISSRSQQKDEAWKFISFLLRPDVNVRFAEMVAQLPGNTSGNADFIDKDPAIKVAQNILREHQSVEELRKTPKAVPSWQILTEEIQKMLKGEQDPAATAKNAHERWNKFFDE
jgi:multiple sugar transport system substrate-binding protein